ncbi:hypothetical protein GCM10027614_82710 [Micromonospora vulcania]
MPGPPEGEGPSQVVGSGLGGPGGERAVPRRGEVGEAVGVQLLPADDELIARRSRCQVLSFGVAQGTSHLVDVVLEQFARGPRRRLGPELPPEVVRRYDLVGVRQQRGQQRSALGLSQRCPPAVVVDLDRPEYPVPHRRAVVG